MDEDSVKDWRTAWQARTLLLDAASDPEKLDRFLSDDDNLKLVNDLEQHSSHLEQSSDWHRRALGAYVRKATDVIFDSVPFDGGSNG